KRTRYKAKLFAGDYEIAGHISIQFAARMKYMVTLPASTKMDVIYDGKELWVTLMGVTQLEKNAEQVEIVKTALYIDAVLQLADLHGEGYKLTALGESKVRGDPAVGVRVAKDGKSDVNLWFGKKSRLLLKSEFDGHHPLTVFLALSR